MAARCCIIDLDYYNRTWCQKCSEIWRPIIFLRWNNLIAVSWKNGLSGSRGLSPFAKHLVLHQNQSEKAVSLAQQSESVKTQQPMVRGEVQQETAIEAVKGARNSQTRKHGTPQTKLSSCPQGARMCEKDVESQAPTAEHSAQQRTQYVISVANWGTTKQYVEVSQCSQELEQWKKKGTIPF